MEGGGAEVSFRLGDISDPNDLSDLFPIASASLVGVNASLAAARAGLLGGFSLNTYFDTFGLEGILANICLILILFQIARWSYSTFYNKDGSRPWSPIVFVFILMAIQILHDLTFYYGAINILPGGKNEMIDILKKYASENGSRAVGGHAVFLIVVATVAMYLKEASTIFAFMVTAVALYLLPFIIATFGPKVAPPPPPPPPPQEKREAFRSPRW
jgi:hypothetical protein